MSSEYDEIDALLGNDSLSVDLEDAEIAELDAILGSINEDNFLSANEEHFLANKNFLENNTASAVDKKLMALQEKLMDQVEDVLEEYSGGCMSGEHFGLDDEHDLLDELEMELDEFGDEDEFGMGNANVLGDVAEFFRPKTQAERMYQQRVRQAKARNRRRARHQKRKGFIQSYEAGVKKAVSEVEDFFRPKRRQRKVRRKSRRISRRSRRQDKVFLASRRKYVALANSLKKACLKFRKLQMNKRTKKNITAIAPGAMAIKPFSIASAAYVSNFPTVASTVSSGLTYGYEPIGDEDILAGDQFGASPRRRRISRRRSPLLVGKSREAQILRAAKACDEKYDRLVAIWKKLSKRGSTAGLKSPREIVSQGFGWLKKAIANADRKVKLSQRERSVVRRNRLLEKRRLKSLREERKRLALAQQRRRAAIARRRQQMLALQKQRELELKRQAKLKKQMLKDAKQEARVEYDALSAMTSYIDEADLKALERASAERKIATLKPVAPMPLLPAPVPVRRRRPSTLPRPRFSVLEQNQINAQKALRQEVARRLRLGGTTKAVGLYKLRKHPAETIVQFEVIRTSFIKKLRKNQKMAAQKRAPIQRRPSPIQPSVRRLPIQPSVRRPAPIQPSVYRPAPMQRRPAPIQPSVRRPAPMQRRPTPRVITSPARSTVIRPAPQKKPGSVLNQRLAVLQKRRVSTNTQLDKATKMHKKALDAKRKAEASRANKIVIQNHYNDVKKYASAASMYRKKLAEIEKQIAMIKG